MELVCQATGTFSPHGTHCSQRSVQLQEERAAGGVLRFGLASVTCSCHSGLRSLTQKAQFLLYSPSKTAVRGWVARREP